MQECKMISSQGCHGQGKIWKMKFFPGQGKGREFCRWSGKFRKHLESQGKVREKSGNLIINGHGSVQKLYTVDRGV